MIVNDKISVPGLDEDSLQLLKEGLIQRFEFTQELAWKVIKDYLAYQGITDIIGSRDAFRHGLQEGLITDARWMNSINDRNITSHAYDESEVGIIYDNIVKVYVPLFKDLKSRFEELEK